MTSGQQIPSKQKSETAHRKPSITQSVLSKEKLLNQNLSGKGIRNVEEILRAEDMAVAHNDQYLVMEEAIHAANQQDFMHNF